MTCRGKVKGGVVVLEAGAQLAEGTLVRVEPIVAETAGAADNGDAIFRMSELAVETGIPDLATNVDHYLYGHPKVEKTR